MVDSMKAGSVIVDLQPKTAATVNTPCRVKSSLRKWCQSDWLYRSSGPSADAILKLYGTNLVNLLKLLCKEKDGISLLILMMW